MKKPKKQNYEIDLSKSGEEILHEYIVIIKKLHKDLEEFIVKSGIQLEKYNFLIKNLEKKSYEHIVNVYQFLIELKDNEHKNMKKTFDLLPAHVWENQKILFKETIFPEQIHLKEAKKAVRDKWLTRPRYIKKEVK